MTPSLEQFIKLASKGNLIPVYQDIEGDCDTPVSAYLKIADSAKHSFLLESVEGEEKIARYSFVASCPELIVESKGGVTTIIRPQAKSSSISKKVTDTPLSHIRSIMRKYKAVPVAGLPRFYGGLVGFLSYDIVRYFENLPNKTIDDLKIPDMILVLAKNLVIFDHRNHKMKIVSCVELSGSENKKQLTAKYAKALTHIKNIKALLDQPLLMHPKKKNKLLRKIMPRSNVTKAQFCRMVEEAKKDIKNGEIIQVVLSQRFEVDLRTDPFNIYRTLRVLNPSPYMYYLNLDSIQLVGSSPELLVRCENGLVETRPIAGTRPRGKNHQEDVRLAKELLADEKEKAEHIMLVDLGRNDLGRVSKQGSVRISEFMKIEHYSHVMHIISNVQGTLDASKDDFDVLQAAFPAGTVSGAPKIRAMEIIERLEKKRRGPYAGCIGYFSFSGNLDSCITIRTIVVKSRKAYVQAGAGIVADSKPEKEYQETINKAKAQLMAIEQAHQQV